MNVADLPDRYEGVEARIPQGWGDLQGPAEGVVHLPNRRTGEDFAHALIPVLRTLPDQLRRSLTWDQGKEMALHKKIAFEADIGLYFCDPRSPWQRGSNENTNGLLRQYFPKGTSIAAFTQEQLDEIAAKLNGRPRQTLNWMTPSEKLHEVLR